VANTISLSGGRRRQDEATKGGVRTAALSLHILLSKKRRKGIDIYKKKCEKKIPPFFFPTSLRWGGEEKKEATVAQHIPPVKRSVRWQRGVDFSQKRGRGGESRGVGGHELSSFIHSPL